MKKNDFENKVVLVTGGTGGIGLATVKEFMKENAFVYFTDINAEKGQQTEKHLGNNVTFIKHDVASEEDWKNVIGRIEKEHGKLDVLVNVAGISLYKPFGKMSLEEYMRVVNINQVSVFLGQKNTLELLKKGDNPAIINIASIAGLEGSRDGAAYHSSKAAVISLTECAALEFADFGIRVNSISPGAVLTDMVLNNEEYRDAINKMIEAVPLKKIANSEDIAKAISFLASSYAPVITGTNLIIDGGSTKV